VSRAILKKLDDIQTDISTMQGDIKEIKTNMKWSKETQERHEKEIGNMKQTVNRIYMHAAGLAGVIGGGAAYLIDKLFR